MDLRISKGFKQSDIAKITGVSRETISRWEKGKMLPSDSNIEKIAKVLEIDKNVLSTVIKARYYARQLKLLGCSPDDYEYLYEQVA